MKKIGISLVLLSAFAIGASADPLPQITASTRATVTCGRLMLTQDSEKLRFQNFKMPNALPFETGIFYGVSNVNGVNINPTAVYGKIEKLFSKVSPAGGIELDVEKALNGVLVEVIAISEPRFMVVKKMAGKNMLVPSAATYLQILDFKPIAAADCKPVEH